MQQLVELQRRMAAALLGSENSGMESEVVENGAAANDRIDIYKNNVVITLTDAIAQVYPVIHRLVGDHYFRQVARGFVRGHPPRKRSLIYYGGEFPDFLAIQPSAAAHPYLGDVAKLEWACHLAFHAPEAATTDLACWQQVPADAWPGARIRMSPSLQLIRSSYPIVRIWQENQPNRDVPPTIELVAGQTFASVSRPDCDVEARSHTAAEFQLISLLKGGTCLQEAYEAAMEANGPLDLEALLREWMAARLIVDIDPAEGSGP